MAMAFSPGYSREPFGTLVADYPGRKVGRVGFTRSYDQYLYARDMLSPGYAE